MRYKDFIPKKYDSRLSISESAYNSLKYIIRINENEIINIYDFYCDGFFPNSYKVKNPTTAFHFRIYFLLADHNAWHNNKFTNVRSMMNIESLTDESIKSVLKRLLPNIIKTENFDVNTYEQIKIDEDHRKYVAKMNTSYYVYKILDYRKIPTTLLSQQENITPDYDKAAQLFDKLTVNMSVVILDGLKLTIQKRIMVREEIEHHGFNIKLFTKSRERN